MAHAHCIDDRSAAAAEGPAAAAEGMRDAYYLGTCSSRADSLTCD